VVVGGRYGLASKEFTPAMVHAVLRELDAASPRRRFTVGIVDDVTETSLPVTEALDIEPPGEVGAVFYGLGSDGTVGANKNSIKILTEDDDRFGQGYFVYDSKKAGAVTVSHLRFGPSPIRAPYLLRRAEFVGCHQFGFLERLDVLAVAAPRATVLLNAPYAPDAVWDHLPREVQEAMLEKQVRLFVIDAYGLARELGLGGRINAIMQSAFFALSGVLPREAAVARIKEAIARTYARKGAVVVERNCAAVDATLAALHEVPLPGQVTATRGRQPVVPREAPDFVQRVTAALLAGHGDLLPVSAFPVDGTWPLGTARWEKRGLAREMPVWDAALCIQCNKCALMCPHAAIRAKVYAPEARAAAPAAFKATSYRAGEFRGLDYTIQVAPDDCTGCGLCVEVCPAKDRSNPRHKAIDMAPQPPLAETERENYAFFLALPEPDRTVAPRDVKGSQLLEPLFEYSGACAGCGETSYVKLLTQLFGDRALIANATGCSSIYGGNLPTTPYTTNRDGRGPAWSNSLFEDNAEFGLGFRLAVDQHAARARMLVRELAGALGDTLAGALLDARQDDEAGIATQRARVAALRERLTSLDGRAARDLAGLADYLVRKSVWIVGGDGWAYDIGYGGLDHVLALGQDVNILVLDTEVYSNTGGQQSKATPLGAAAKFAAAGKRVPKKDLGLMAMSAGHAYVAQVALGGRDAQALRAFQEAEAYPGPSLIIAFSPCIAHGYDLRFGADQQKRAVESGYWPVYRYDPRRLDRGETPLVLDTTGPPKLGLADYVSQEARFRMVEQQDPPVFRELMASAERDLRNRIALYETLAHLAIPKPTT